jgi:hypothetical protein
LSNVGRGLGAMSSRVYSLFEYTKNPLQNFEKLVIDSDSPSPITFAQTLRNIVLSSKKPSFDRKKLDSLIKINLSAIIFLLFEVHITPRGNKLISNARNHLKSFEINEIT